MSKQRSFKVIRVGVDWWIWVLRWLFVCTIFLTLPTFQVQDTISLFFLFLISFYVLILTFYVNLLEERTEVLKFLLKSNIKEHIEELKEEQDNESQT